MYRNAAKCIDTETQTMEMHRKAARLQKYSGMEPKTTEMHRNTQKCSEKYNIHRNAPKCSRKLSKRKEMQLKIPKCSQKITEIHRNLDNTYRNALKCNKNSTKVQ